MFPRVGFIVTNLTYPTIGSPLLQWPGHGGAMDQRRQVALNWTRLSCHKPTREALFVMAYNLGNF